LGFTQITRNTPPRLTNLHLAQIFFTEERTFISTLFSSYSGIQIDFQPKLLGEPSSPEASRTAIAFAHL
jgi:hypothetical protein